MNINFTLGVDVDADQLTGLFAWLEETYHQVDVSISVPEFTADAVTETGPFHPLVVAVDEATDDTGDVYSMCKCGHTDHVHTVAANTGCIVAGCSCESFDQIVVDWQTESDM